MQSHLSAIWPAAILLLITNAHGAPGNHVPILASAPTRVNKPNLARLAKRSPAYFEEATMVGPRCIPLTSSDKRYNPYHRDLISVPGAQVRHGFGPPAELVGQGPHRCETTTPCRLTLERTSSASITDTLSISRSSSKTQSVAIGRTSNTGTVDQVARSISRGVERAISNVDTSSSDESISDQISKGLTDTHQSSTSTSKTRSIELSMSSGKTQDWEVSAGFQISGKDWSFNLGGSVRSGSSKTSSSQWGESSTDERSESDAVAKSVETLRGKTSSRGTSNSRTNSQSSSYTASDTATDTRERSKGTSDTRESGAQAQASFNRELAIANSTTVGLKFESEIRPGTCKWPVCRPIMRSMVVPYVCVSPETGEPTDAVSEIHLVEIGLGKNLSCVTTLVECEPLGQIQFEVANAGYNMANERDSLEYGAEFRVGESLASANNKFDLTLTRAGELMLTQNKDTIVWSNGIRANKFEEYKKRARINRLGHLVVEVSIKQASNDTGSRGSACQGESIFSEAHPEFECKSDDWTVIWSSTALENQHTSIGVGKRAGEQFGYKLIVSNKGELRLYDAYAVLTWCSGDHCRHSSGYKYPRRYLVPTNVLTERVEGDPHNSLPGGLVIRATPSSAGTSETLNGCHELQVGHALRSNNGRFHAFLDARGNFVVKDGERTMWSSTSGGREFARGPYKLKLRSSGQAEIVDEEFELVLWRTRAAPEAKEGPFSLRMMDSGQLSIVDGAGKQVWSSWTPRDDISTEFLASLEPRAEQMDRGCNKTAVTASPVEGKYLVTPKNGECLWYDELHSVHHSNCSQVPGPTKLWFFHAKTETLRARLHPNMCLEGPEIGICNHATSLRFRDSLDGLEFFKLCKQDKCIDGNELFVRPVPLLELTDTIPDPETTSPTIPTTTTTTSAPIVPVAMTTEKNCKYKRCDRPGGLCLERELVCYV